MPQQSIGARFERTSAVRFVSRVISTLVLVSVLAVSMPAAPRMIVDTAPKLPTAISSVRSSLDNLNYRLTNLDALPVVDSTPIVAAFNGSVAFAADLKAVALPSVPAGLENAKLPTFGERTFAFFAPLLAFLKPSSTNATPSQPVSLTPPQPTSVVDFEFRQ